MQTELQFSVIYLEQEANDIHNFDFFIRMVPTKDRNIVSVVSVPRYSLNGQQVKHIKFSICSENNLYAYDVLSIIAQLKELESIVCDTALSAEDAEQRLKQLMLNKIEHYGRE